jgi:hypothetical protein
MAALPILQNKPLYKMDSGSVMGPKGIWLRTVFLSKGQQTVWTVWRTNTWDNHDSPPCWNIEVGGNHNEPVTQP